MQLHEHITDMKSFVNFYQLFLLLGDLLLDSEPGLSRAGEGEKKRDLFVGDLSDESLSNSK